MPMSNGFLGIGDCVLRTFMNTAKAQQTLILYPHRFPLRQSERIPLSDLKSPSLSVFTDISCILTMRLFNHGWNSTYHDLCRLLLRALVSPLVICLHNLTETDILVLISGMGIFFRHLQTDRHHRAGMDAGHTADTALTIPDTLLPLQMKTFFRADLCLNQKVSFFKEICG